jgi:hypothetical protein
MKNATFPGPKIVSCVLDSYYFPVNGHDRILHTGGVAKVAPFRAPRIHEVAEIVLSYAGLVFTCNLVVFSLALQDHLTEWSSS